jgi:hypothetical protein
MADKNWTELEYQSLRAEILALISSQESAIRFFLPAAAAVYGVPYVLGQTSQTFLWSICAGGAALMIVAMSYTVLAYIESVRKIGTYTKEVIETRTNGTLLWETILFEWHREGSSWPPEQVTISSLAIIANVAAAFGAGHVFLHGDASLIPGLTAIILGLFAVPAVVRMWRSSHQRERYAREIRAIMRELSSPDAARPAAG